MFIIDLLISYDRLNLIILSQAYPFKLYKFINFAKHGDTLADMLLCIVHF